MHCRFINATEFSLHCCMVTVRLQLKTLLPCILHLTPEIEIIYYRDYRKCILKGSISLISIVDYLHFRGQLLLQILQVIAVYICNKVFTCRIWDQFIQQWIPFRREKCHLPKYNFSKTLQIFICYFFKNLSTVCCIL